MQLWSTRSTNTTRADQTRADIAYDGINIPVTGEKLANNKQYTRNWAHNFNTLDAYGLRHKRRERGGGCKIGPLLF